MKCVLTIAGSDSCGGAGIQADIKTITSLGAHAMTAVTALTAQNSLGIEDIHGIPAEFLRRQVECVLSDVTPDAVKIGMLATVENIREVAGLIRNHRLSRIVLDPVLRASTGADLLEVEAVSALKNVLLPLVNVVTPNLAEAEALTEKRVSTLQEMEEAAREIKTMGPEVVLTGGHLQGDASDLVYDGNHARLLRGTRIQAVHTHGTGCVFSSAVAVFLAGGDDLFRAAERAKEFTREAIKGGYPCGRGIGPINPGIGIRGERS